MKYPAIIDSHCHLDFDAFDTDRLQVIARANENNISHIIIPATQKHTWGAIQSLCSTHKNLYACYGLHPHWTDQHTNDDIDALKHWATLDDCIGIGECGLDYREGQADKKKQINLFEAQLQIATENNLPIVIHAVNATEDIINLIKKHPNSKGKMHSYTGSYQQAQQLIDLDYYISFGGTITYEMASKHRSTASKLPLSTLMIESNAPDQPDCTHKNERNEPAYLITILECLSELRNEDINEIAEQTCLNTKALFNL